MARRVVDSLNVESDAVFIHELSTQTLGRVARTNHCGKNTAGDTRVAVTEAQPHRMQIAVIRSTARESRRR